MKLLLAPMATLTHQPLRLTINQFGGCDEYFTEMIQAGTVLTNSPFEKYYLLTAPHPEKLVWQITGNKTDSMAKAAELLCGIGGLGLDINMGCSAPDIVKTGAGIAWMLKPICETEYMLKQVKKTIDSNNFQQRFSVKIRLGDENFSETNFFSFIDMLAYQGIQQITLHPRTRKEKYRQKPKLEYVHKLCEYIETKNYQIDVILNGGIEDKLSLENAKKIAPKATGFMIGRAAIQKPWIFSILKNIQPEKIDILQTALDFISYLEQYQPPEFYKTRLQRFFTYYSDNVKFSHHLRTQLLNNATPDGCREELKKYFSQCSNEQYLFF